MRQDGIHEMHGVGFELIRLDLVVLVQVDLSEDGIDVLISDWEVDLVLGKELMQEFSEFLSVKETVGVFVEGGEVNVNFLLQVVGNLLEIGKLLNDLLGFFKCEFFGFDHL